jgi:hypothetical protein
MCALEQTALGKPHARWQCVEPAVLHVRDCGSTSAEFVNWHQYVVSTPCCLCLESGKQRLAPGGEQARSYAMDLQPPADAAESYDGATQKLRKLGRLPMKQRAPLTCDGDLEARGLRFQTASTRRIRGFPPKHRTRARGGVLLMWTRAMPFDRCHWKYQYNTLIQSGCCTSQRC